MMMRATLRWTGALGLVCCLATGVGCKDARATEAQRVIVEKHAPDLARTVVADLARHRVGLQKAADRLAAGFVKVEGEQQAKELRWALQKIHQPPKGISELIVSPMSFMAAVGMDGKVIARDAEPDRMRGMDVASQFPAVRAALQGRNEQQIGAFESLKEGGRPSVSIVMAAPAHHHGEVVGAVALGIPLWRLAQRLGRQLQLEHAAEPDVILWAYIYQGDALFHHATPPDLDKLVPDAAARHAGLARSPGGYTGEVAQFGRWYAYGVRPLRMLGEDVGVIIFRSDPM